MSDACRVLCRGKQDGETSKQRLGDMEGTQKAGYVWHINMTRFLVQTGALFGEDELVSEGCGY